jgi:hypothetical protein
MLRFNRAATVCLAVGLAAVSCRTPKTESEVSQFFANSTRRDAQQAERDAVVRVDNCTGYYIQNTQGRLYVGSARHCVNNVATEWCAAKSTVYTPDFSLVGTCKRVVGGTGTKDIVIFELDKDPDFTVPSGGYRLAAYTPAKYTNLKMIGFPTDKFRNGALTVTEGCYVLKAPVYSPHSNSNWGDWSAMHNCTTYGGNSGGPILKVGTNEVIGLPFTYVKNDYNERQSDNEFTAAHLALMSGFVQDNRAALSAAGIIIAEGNSGLSPTTTTTTTNTHVRPQASTGAGKCVTTTETMVNILLRLRKLDNEILTIKERLSMIEYDLRKQKYGTCPSNSAAPVEGDQGCVPLAELDEMADGVKAEVQGLEEGKDVGVSDNMEKYRAAVSAAQSKGICGYPFDTGAPSETP